MIVMTKNYFINVADEILIFQIYGNEIQNVIIRFLYQ